MEQYPQALTIAGSDSDGSAGMQADLHTFFARKVYGASVMTACVAGNSYGIEASVTLPSTFIDKEFELLAADYKIRASKTDKNKILLQLQLFYKKWVLKTSS